jgi:hypothetical protein
MNRCVARVTLAIVGSLIVSGCASEKVKNYAKESAARYWQDKAYPGKAYDVQVVEAESVDGGQWRVRGIVDGETRVGVFNPETETFSEGYYSLAHERNKRIAELEQESKYWKEKSESLEKEIYKMQVKASVRSSKKKKPQPEIQEDDADEEDDIVDEPAVAGSKATSPLEPSLAPSATPKP